MVASPRLRLLRGFCSGPSRIVQAARRPPLFRLEDAIVKHLAAPPTLSLTIPDASDRIFALVGPSSSSGPGKALQLVLLSHLLGQSRPKVAAATAAASDGAEPRMHGHLHPFLDDSRSLPSRVQHASFVRQHAGGSDFSNFTARYGALRGEDQTTLFEALMEVMGFHVGRIARANIVEDPLFDEQAEEGKQIAAAGESSKAKPHVLPSGIASPETRRAARAARDRIEEYAKLFALDRPGPGAGHGVRLLDQPLVSLSNGQTRRARILSSLVKLHGRRERFSGEEEQSHDELASSSSSSAQSSLLLVLSEPYSGLDPPSRKRLTAVLGDLHRSGTRVVVLLRRQDEMPDIITDVIDVDSQGHLWLGSRQEWEQRRALAEGEDQQEESGIMAIERNHGKGKGTGRGESLIELRDVSIQYGDKVVLDVRVMPLRFIFNLVQLLTTATLRTFLWHCGRAHA